MLAKLLLAGVEAYPVSQAIVRKTLVFDPANTSIAVSYANVGKLLTLARLLEEEPSLDDEPFNLPTTGFWYKNPPRVGPAPHGKRQLTQEWEWVEDYVSALFGAPMDVSP